MKKIGVVPVKESEVGEKEQGRMGYRIMRREGDRSRGRKAEERKGKNYRKINEN